MRKSANTLLPFSKRRSRSGSNSGGVRIEHLEGRVLLSTYVVSTAGSDHNAGTLWAPFRTIQHAADLAAAGDTVLIRGGVYRETVSPANSGAPGAPITFAAYNGENVTVSGANVVAGWANYSGSIYSTSVPWNLGIGADQVFVDGSMMNEARWPNTSLDLEHPALAYSQWVTGPNGNVTLYDSHLNQPAGFWNGAYIHILSGKGWTAQTGQVTSSADGQLTFTYQEAGSASEHPTAGNGYYLFGKFQALDAPAEWYHDPTTGRLYLWTPHGDSPAAHLIEVKARPYAFDVRGDSDIHIDGINVFAATIASDYNSARLVINHLNAMYTSQFTLQNVGWHQPRDRGISLFGPNSLIENSTVTYSAGDGIFVGGNSTRVTNCTVSNVDYNDGDSAGVRIEGASWVQVDHTTVYNTARDGLLQFGWDVKLLNNTIHDCMQGTTDGGGIYTVNSDGGGSEIAYNRIYNVHGGGYGGAGIYLDNNSSDYIVHHNITWNVDYGLKLNYTSRNQLIYNNTFDATAFSIASNQAGDWNGTRVANNILFANNQFSTGVALGPNLYANTNPRVANRWGANYLLMAGSPAIGSGIAIGIGGAGSDMGALAYGAAPFASGAPAGSGGTSVSDNPNSTPSPVPPPTPTPPPDSIWSARNTWTAVNCYASHALAMNSGVIGGNNGAWAEYHNLNFGNGVSSFQATVAVAPAYANQQIQIRIDGVNGQVIGILRPRSTGSWWTYALESTAVSRVIGVHDLYLVYAGSYGIGDIRTFQFA